MNNSISNVLEIYKLVLQNNGTKEDAAKELGKKHKVDYQDLLASCTKTLNISPDKFDYFLDSQNRFNFKNFLFRRFPDDEDRITQFFNSFEDTSNIPILDFTKLIKPSRHHKPIKLSSELMIISLKDSFLDWIARPDVPQDVKKELKNWITRIEGKEQ
ncbi:MAG: hypothetical protein JSW20_13235 [Nitrospiraceae bacterium]|nr:MAG: hypothetical protein JSW20_13235 [Nitrospiraceae bacterium]